MAGGGSKGGANQNVFQQAATAYNAAGGATAAAFDKFSNLGGYKPALAGDAATYKASTAATPALIASGMDRYMNPYTQDVVDRSLSTIDRARRLALQQNGDAAQAAGAFGGSRHGLVEATTNAEAARTAADTSATLFDRAFTTAAGLSGQDVANRMGIDTFNAGLKTNASAANAGAQNQFALADAIAKNEASRFGGSQAATGASGMLAAGGQAGALAGQGLSMGQSINNQNAIFGGQQQQVVQALIDAAKGNFAGFTGQGKELLSLIASTIAGSPLNNQTTTSQTYNPGLFDYLSLAAQTAGSLYKPSPV